MFGTGLNGALRTTRLVLGVPLVVRAQYPLQNLSERCLMWSVQFRNVLVHVGFEQCLFLIILVTVMKVVTCKLSSVDSYTFGDERAGLSVFVGFEGL